MQVDDVTSVSRVVTIVEGPAHPWLWFRGLCQISLNLLCTMQHELRRARPTNQARYPILTRDTILQGGDKEPVVACRFWRTGV